MPKLIVNNAVCPICHSLGNKTMYNGIIRLGKFGHWSEKAYIVYRCLSCQTGYLPGVGFDYHGSEYRDNVDGVSTSEAYFKSHDKEQAERLQVLGSENIRRRIVADIGCGAGSFLDLCRGSASKTIAIEPCRDYHNELALRHEVYSCLDDVLNDYAGQVDLAVSFAVLEHVDDPIRFLRQIRRLLKDGGRLLLSTPNTDDWLIDFLPGIYDRFFFRKAHRFYFNGDSIRFLAEKTGFIGTEIIYKHRFDISNALHWIRDQKPCGKGTTPIFSDLDESYSCLLEHQGKTDFIYAWLEL